MKRLTPKNWKELYEPYHKNGGYFGEEFESNEVDDMILRLAELEDKLESGELVEAPVGVGDKIYVVPSKVVYDINVCNRDEERNRIFELTIKEIRFNKRGYYIVTCDCSHVKTGDSFGETWFLTKAEAQAKLDELKGNKD